MTTRISARQSRALLAGFGAALLYLAAGAVLEALLPAGAGMQLLRILAAPLPVVCWAVAQKQPFGLCRPGPGVLLPAALFVLVAGFAAWWFPSEVPVQSGVLAAVRLCLAAPLAEEIVFRGAVQSFLQPLGGGTAVLLQALLFAVQHGSAAAVAYAFCMGLVFGWMRQRTGSVLPGAALHIINNLLVFWAG